jgi:hypothetical protein
MCASALFSYVVVEDFLFTNEYVPALGGDNELPGDYTDGETPDPIPNSEAKLVQADGSP